jgi:epoxyqueuosine reductase
MESLRQKIKIKALELGFSFCGFAKAEPLKKEGDFFTSYLKEKRNAGLHYLERIPEKRINPQLLFEDARTVIGLLMNYFPKEIVPGTDNFIISKYAYGKDYHEVLKKRANALISFMKEELGALKAKSFVDHGPVMEKAWAKNCGLGWIGKNTLLINLERGSFHFIAIILTDLPVEPDLPGSDHCGSCHICIDACPTGALDKPFELDPSKCLSYLTIEERSGIPAVMIDKVHGHIYGCDICQDVCPYNRFAVPTSIDDFQPVTELRSYRKKEWLKLTKDQFEIIFRDSVIYRIGYEKLMRNISIASGITDT